MQLYHLENYNKLNNTVYWLDNNSALTLTVEIHKHNRFFYAEYSSNNGTNIYTDFGYYLEIGSMFPDENGNRVKFRIDNSNMYQFVKSIQTITDWLITKAGDGLFIEMKNGIIKVNPKFTAVKIAGPYNGLLEIVPTVRYNKSNGQPLTGISIFINNTPDPIFLSTVQFLNFSYFIEKFNMYEAALAMINFLGRPTVNNQAGDMPKQPNKYSSGFFSKTGAKPRSDDNE